MLTCNGGEGRGALHFRLNKVTGGDDEEDDNDSNEGPEDNNVVYYQVMCRAHTGSTGTRPVYGVFFVRIEDTSV